MTQSINGILGLLSAEKSATKPSSSELMTHLISTMLLSVDNCWPEIADHLSTLETMWEAQSVSANKQPLSLLLSKVYFHLGEYKMSLFYALCSQSLFLSQFDSSYSTATSSAIVGDAVGDYVGCVVRSAIDHFISLQLESKEVSLHSEQQKQHNEMSVDGTVGERLKIEDLRAFIEMIFTRSLKELSSNSSVDASSGKLSSLHQMIVGMALECQRLDFIQSLFNASLSQCAYELLNYTCSVVMSLTFDLTFRNKVLYLLADLYKQIKGGDVDYLMISKCYIWLNDSTTLSALILQLMAGGNSNVLLAYQVAFDVYNYATQKFISALIASVSAQAAKELPQTSDAHIKNIVSILSGDLAIKLQLEFLFRSNKSDPLVLSNIMSSISDIGRSSLYHSALSLCNGLINAGTTSDQFLRDNMDWLSKANHWSKFTATSQLGVIHKGNLANSMNLLSPYLPQEGASVSTTDAEYSEGGALYALGFIHANHGTESVISYLNGKFATATNEVVRHGLSLGIGAAALATGNQAIYENLKAVLFTDSAIAGEATGIAMGLIMVGSCNLRAIEEMLQYARETQHEKIIKGLAVGIAMILYRCEERADEVIKKLITDKDPLLRYSAAYTLGLAYVGTASNKATKQLLHIAVSDSNDDVRRAAVTCLGFVFLQQPKQLPRVVQLSVNNYNPAVRYGAAMALGIAFAGTAAKEALDLIDILAKDPTDFVRQGAYIASAMILIQQNDTNARAVHYRAQYAKVIGSKHEDSMAKFGAIISSGIIDAGGRNVTIQTCRDGHVVMESVVGLAVFMQFWSWHPFIHFISLAFTPTCLIALDEQLKMPKIEVISNAKPSVFAYPKPLSPAKDEKVEKLVTAVLSTTKKAKARAKKSESDAMETDSLKSPVLVSPTTKDAEMKPADSTSAEEKKEEKEDTNANVPEPAFETLQNMSRVLPAQAPLLSLKSDSRYTKVVKKGSLYGIILLVDNKPTESKDYIDFSTPEVVAAGAGEEQDAPAPEPFEYFDDQMQQ